MNYQVTILWMLYQPDIACFVKRNSVVFDKKTPHYFFMRVEHDRFTIVTLQIHPDVEPC